jgi:hypothetical protein
MSGWTFTDSERWIIDHSEGVLGVVCEDNAITDMVEQGCRSGDLSRRRIFECVSAHLKKG